MREDEPLGSSLGRRTLKSPTLSVTFDRIAQGWLSVRRSKVQDLTEE
jgi:hypothetical protein